MNKKTIKQGDVFICTIGDTIDSEQSINGRPCLIIQNDKGNEYSKTTIISPLTKKMKKPLPIHFPLKKEDYDFLEYDSIVLGEQIRCISKRRCERKIGEISQEDLDKIIEMIYINFK